MGAWPPLLGLAARGLGHPPAWPPEGPRGCEGVARGLYVWRRELPRELASTTCAAHPRERAQGASASSSRPRWCPSKRPGRPFLQEGSACLLACLLAAAAAQTSRQTSRPDLPPLRVLGGWVAGTHCNHRVLATHPTHLPEGRPTHPSPGGGRGGRKTQAVPAPPPTHRPPAVHPPATHPQATHPPTHLQVDKYLSASGYLPPSVKPFFVALPKDRQGGGAGIASTATSAEWRRAIQEVDASVKQHLRGGIEGGFDEERFGARIGFGNLRRWGRGQGGARPAQRKPCHACLAQNVLPCAAVKRPNFQLHIICLPSCPPGRFLEEELARRYRDAAPATLALLQERCESVARELIAADKKLAEAGDVVSLRRSGGHGHAAQAAQLCKVLLPTMHANCPKRH